jgi:hypothetical protein
MWCQYYPDLIRGAFTLVTATAGVSLGAMLALRGYFRQREYELVRDRYLVGAIDVVAAELEKSFGAFRHNSSRCLELMKMFRDEDEAFNTEELSKGFVDYTVTLPMIAHHRLGDLVGSQVLWHLYQAAIAFVIKANDKIGEYLETIRLKVDKKIVTETSKVIFDDAYQSLGELDTESQRFAILMRALHKIGQMLEQEKLTFERAVKFSRRPDLKKLLADLERELKDELEDFVEEPASGSKPA